MTPSVRWQEAGYATLALEMSPFEKAVARLDSGLDELLAGLKAKQERLARGVGNEDRG